MLTFYGYDYTGSRLYWKQLSRYVAWTRVGDWQAIVERARAFRSARRKATPAETAAGPTVVPNEAAIAAYEAKLTRHEAPTRELFVFCGLTPLLPATGRVAVEHCTPWQLDRALGGVDCPLKTAVLAGSAFTPEDLAVVMGRLVHRGVRVVTDSTAWPSDEVKQGGCGTGELRPLDGRWRPTPWQGLSVFVERRWSPAELKAVQVLFGNPTYFSRRQMEEHGLGHLAVTECWLAGAVQRLEQRCWSSHHYLARDLRRLVPPRAGSYPRQLDVRALREVGLRPTLANIPDDYLQFLWQQGWLYGRYAQQVRQYLEEFVWPALLSDADRLPYLDEAALPRSTEDAKRGRHYPRMWQDLSAYVRSDSTARNLRPYQQARKPVTAEDDTPLEVAGRGWKEGGRHSWDTLAAEFVSSLEAWQDLVERLTRPSPLVRVAVWGLRQPEEHDTGDAVIVDAGDAAACKAAAWRLLLQIEDAVTGIADRITARVLERDAAGLNRLEQEADLTRQAARRAWRQAEWLVGGLAAIDLRQAWADLDARFTDAWQTLNDDPCGQGLPAVDDDGCPLNDGPGEQLVTDEERREERELRRRAEREAWCRHWRLTGAHCYPSGRPRAAEPEGKPPTHTLLVGPRRLKKEDFLAQLEEGRRARKR
jgi:hypothetical protein